MDLLLKRAGLPMVLLSPQGVAFAATRPEWQFAVAPPLTQARIDAIRATRQFGRHFDNGVASALPFAADTGDVQINGVTYAVERRAIDWHDPGGEWQLVALDDISALMSSTQRARIGAVAFVLLCLLGLLLLDLLRSRAVWPVHWSGSGCWVRRWRAARCPWSSPMATAASTGSTPSTSATRAIRWTRCVAKSHRWWPADKRPRRPTS